MAEQEYRYQGPPSGIVLAGADGAAAREEMLVAGRELRLDDGDPQVAELVARGHLAPASTDADKNRDPENR